MPRRSPTRTAALALATLATLAGTAARPFAVEAQTPPRAQFGEEMVVSEVLLDVLVTDAGGNVIAGLGPGDFAVEEEGRPVTVTSAAFYSSRRFLGGAQGATGAPPGADRVPEDRYFVLFFDRPPLALASPWQRRLLPRVAEAGEATFRWLVQELLPTDLVAVAGYDGGLALYHDFSRDRRRLAEAVRRAAAGRHPPPRWPSRTEQPEAGKSLATLLGRPHLRAATADLYGAVAVLAEALGRIGGRKNLILVGADFPAPGSRQAQRGYSPMVEALNGANVAAYTLGLADGRQESLARLAADTGGDYDYGFRDALEPLRRIARETSGYYLLSYRSRHPAGTSGYREVSVRTVNPEFRVRSRSGYRYGQ